ncbi:MAG: alpha/beta hydrolase [Allosphingosinicella sp.]|uniref:alpha/beta hydrolase n=1 Tax=Allosphingosinicella sp. TaxID=2823234 RepID=UPI003962E03D
MDANDRRRLPRDARLTVWTAPDGWRHRRIDWPRKPGTARRGSLLFAGGRGDFIEKYLEAKAHWRGAGWDVTSFDWRGQGASRGDIAGGHLDDLTRLVDDLEALIAEWRAETEGPNVVVAHSMGGHVLLRLLAERRPALDAAVLVAPMLMINSAPLPTMGAWWLAAAAAGFGWARRPVWQQGETPPPVGSQRHSILTSCPGRYADELWWWEREPGYNLGAPSWGWLNAAYRSCAALTPDKLRQVKVPVLLVGTEADRLVSPSAIRSAAAAIPGARLKMFDRAAHEILRESDPVRLEALAEIDRFLAEHAG